MAARARHKDGPGARERMLDAAERLLAEYGIEGVSLRQIGTATGQGNNSAVQYYFGDKAGLIREIINRRVAGFETRRRQLLDEAAAAGRLQDVRALLEVIYRPLAELVDEDGRHTYARFMMQFLTRFQHQPGITHPGWAPDSAATEAVGRLRACLPFLEGRAMATRISRVGGLFFHALIERDNAQANGIAVEPDDLFWDDVAGMMEAAISRPLPQSRRR